MRKPLYKAHLRPGVRGAAMEWLASNDRLGSCLNIYDNGSAGLLFVFDHRATALMLKLAVG